MVEKYFFCCDDKYPIQGTKGSTKLGLREGGGGGYAASASYYRPGPGCFESRLTLIHD